MQSTIISDVQTRLASLTRPMVQWSSSVPRTTLVVIDQCIEDYIELVAGLAPAAAVLILDPQQDGVDQITTACSLYPQLNSLHLVSHGAPGCLYLGNTQLSLATLEHYVNQLQRWFCHPDRQLLLYGCNVAAGDAGSELIKRLQWITGAAIAASSTPIGNAALGGNWELDVTTQAMTVSPCFRDEVMQSYAALFTAGSLDPSFGVGGKVQTPGSFGAALAYQSDGKLLVAGSIGGSNSSFALNRYNSDGSLDTSFDGDGRVTTNFYTPSFSGLSDTESPKAVLVQPDGKIVVVGSASNDVRYVPDFALVRYNSDGSLDSTFGTGGQVRTYVGGESNYAESAVLLSDGKILVAGYTTTSRRSDFALARYNSNGSLDTTFGAGGIVIADIDYADRGGYSIAIQPDNQIIIAGLSRADALGNPNPNNSLTLLRFNANGGLTSSTRTFFPELSFNEFAPVKLVLQTDGKITVAATANPFGVTNQDFSLVRYNNDFTIDTSFGYGGRILIDLGSTNDSVYAVTLQTDGKLLVAGRRSDSLGADFALVRYNGGVGLDSSFGSSGRVITDMGSTSDIASSVLVQPDGNIVVAGSANGVALVRYLSDGQGGGTPPNQAPTDLSLNSATIAENLPANTAVGSFTTIDPDSSGAFTYSLVSGSDLNDNSNFTIVGNTLRTARSFDFESKSTYSIRVRTDDGGGGSFEKPLTITILNVNEAPQLFGSLVNQTATVGTAFNYVVSNYTFYDPELGLNAPSGLTYDATLSDGSALPSWLSFNPTTRTFSGTPGISNIGTLNLVVKATDSGGLFVTTGFSLTISDLNQRPTDLSISSTTVAENLPSGTTVGRFTTIDPNPGDSFTYSIIAATGDNASAFTIVGDTLRAARSFDFEYMSTYNIRVLTDDGKGGTFDKFLTFTIQDVNEAPVVGTAIANQTTTAGTAFSLVVPTTTLSDPDVGDVLALSATLSNGSTLPTWLSFNPTTRTFSGTPTSTNVGTLSLLVKATDRGGLSTTTSFNLTVNSGSTNQAPTNLSLSSTRIAENLASGTTVGTFTTTDPNPGDTFTYSLVSGTGSKDNAAFTIVGNTLRTTRSFNYEAQSTYSVRVRTDDGKGGVFEKVLSLTIDDANDAPIVVTPLTNRTAKVGTAFRYTVPATTFFDEDVAANDDLDWLTLRATLSDGRALPTWLRFNANTGVFSGTPTSAQVGTLSIVVRASDRAGAFVSSSFLLTIQA
ncbi:MAG: DUF4347 domain-containing protein [Lyngbya sp. HA4199-MV5]|jgi:uncharacterized delta-60 repeat protein|nr:DUF4347 domain-containing protein [Lyngbya sp. HA4199-MV5]